MLELLRKFLFWVLDVRGEDGDDDGSDDDGGSDDGSDDDADADSGKSGGKKRSDAIPRKRFDEVNTELAKFKRLKDAGLLAEDEEGNVILNEDAVKSLLKPDKTDSDDKGKSENFRFSKDEVAPESWPLVEKINKGFDHYEGVIRKLIYGLEVLQSENATLRDYPEFLQKEGPLRKKFTEIIQKDPEFKKMYRGNPKAGYYAAKRAAELIAAATASNQQPPKKKPAFIIGKGDIGVKGNAKTRDLSKMSAEELDKLEREEFERGRQKK